MFRVSIITIVLLFAGAVHADQYAVDQLHARVVKAEGGERAALEAQLDKTCAQKDCVTSRLYWNTDFEEAKRVAQTTGRPILVLHLLGRLDEELSCANSRFFRTMLYSDPSISSLMRDDFVLFWHSVRPVPRITIEFGDGRKIQQTITGNSAHYLLSPDGAVLDALPGLYSPGEFREQLERWKDLHHVTDLRGYHAQRMEELKLRWIQLSRRTGVQIQPERTLKLMTAIEATRITQSKARVDTPMLSAMQLATTLRALPTSGWEIIGAYEAETVQFSKPSIELIRRKQFGSAAPAHGAMEALIMNLQASVAGDTIFNECELHKMIHSWFVNGEVTDLASLNARVYEELFLTPDSDPWLGLKQPTVFTAIAN